MVYYTFHDAVAGVSETTNMAQCDKRATNGAIMGGVPVIGCWPGKQALRLGRDQDCLMGPHGPLTAVDFILVTALVYAGTALTMSEPYHRWSNTHSRDDFESLLAEHNLAAHGNKDVKPG